MTNATQIHFYIEVYLKICDGLRFMHSYTHTHTHAKPYVTAISSPEKKPPLTRTWSAHKDRKRIVFVLANLLFSNEFIPDMLQLHHTNVAHMFALVMFHQRLSSSKARLKIARLQANREIFHSKMLVSLYPNAVPGIFLSVFFPHGFSVKHWLTSPHVCLYPRR